MNALYVVNASRVFSMIWPGVRPFVPKDTRDKITIVTKANVKKVLPEAISERYIPTWLDGQCKVGGDRVSEGFLHFVWSAYSETGRRAHANVGRDLDGVNCESENAFF